jgi:hypothetical protein
VLACSPPQPLLQNGACSEPCSHHGLLWSSVFRCDYDSCCVCVFCHGFVTIGGGGVGAVVLVVALADVVSVFVVGVVV